MTTLRQALHEWLRDEIDVSVFDGKLPTRPILPVLVQNYVGAQSVQTHSAPRSLLERRVQIDVWAQNDPEADALELRVIAALDGFHGLMGDLAIGWAMLINATETAPAEIKGGGWQFRRILDFAISYQQRGVSS